MIWFTMCRKIGTIIKLAWKQREKLDDIIAVIPHVDDVLKAIGKKQKGESNGSEFYPKY